MFRFAKTSLVALALTLGIGGAAQAGGYTYYKTVTVWVTREVPYTVCITKWDHCGNPYNAYVTRYKCVQVPVYKKVPVSYGY